MRQQDDPVYQFLKEQVTRAFAMYDRAELDGGAVGRLDKEIAEDDLRALLRVTRMANIEPKDLWEDARQGK